MSPLAEPPGEVGIKGDSGGVVWVTVGVGERGEGTVVVLEGVEGPVRIHKKCKLVIAYRQSYM